MPPAPTSSFSRKRESRGEGWHQPHPNTSNDQVSFSYLGVPATTGMSDCYECMSRTPIRDRPLKHPLIGHSGPPIVIPAKAGIQEGWRGVRRTRRWKKTDPSPHFHPLMRPPQGHGDSSDRKHAPYPDTGPESTHQRPIVKRQSKNRELTNTVNVARGLVPRYGLPPAGNRSDEPSGFPTNTNDPHTSTKLAGANNEYLVKSTSEEHMYDTTNVNQKHEIAKQIPAVQGGVHTCRKKPSFCKTNSPRHPADRPAALEDTCFCKTNAPQRTQMIYRRASPSPAHPDSFASRYPIPSSDAACP